MGFNLREGRLKGNNGEVQQLCCLSHTELERIA